MEALKASYQVAGVDALLVKCGEKESLELTQQLVQLRKFILQELDAIVKEVVPAYTTLLVYYEPRAVRVYDLELAIEQIIQSATFQDAKNRQQRTIEIPVCYGGEYGPDIERVAELAKLSVDDVIAMHEQAEYSVSALGFAPGFAYLAGLPEALETPRLASPRKKVPAGSLGIAGVQTAVYPVEGPGGWNLIGRALQNWFDVEAEPMTPVEAGDRVKFKSVTRKEFEDLLNGGDA